MSQFKSTENIVLSLKLPDRRNNQFPRASVYDNTGTLVSTYNLSLNGNTGYYNIVLASGTLAIGAYKVVYEVFRDSQYTALSSRYASSEEFLLIEDLENIIINSGQNIIDIIDDNDGRIA